MAFTSIKNAKVCRGNTEQRNLGRGLCGQRSVFKFMITDIERMSRGSKMIGSKKGALNWWLITVRPCTSGYSPAASNIPTIIVK